MDGVVGFYEGTGTDQRGRTLEDVWAFDDHQLEAVHDIIQWLFPTDRPSAFNAWAPVLDERSIAELRANPDVPGRLRRSLDRMLLFYGLERSTDGPVEIHPADSIEIRGPRWWGRGNHNHLRLTRMIMSLGLLGLGDEARALERALQHVRADRATGISDETARYWAAAARNADRHV